MTEDKLKVFISYVYPNKLFALNLYNQLINSNIDAWIDKEKIAGGEIFPLSIKSAMRQSDAIIIIFSKKSVDRETFYQTEIKFALELNKEKPENTNFLIPIKLDNCTLPESFHDISYIHPGKSEDDAIINALKKRADQIGKSIEIEKIEFSSDQEILETIKEKDLIKVFKTGMIKCISAREKIKKIYTKLELDDYYFETDSRGEHILTLFAICLEYGIMTHLFDEIYESEHLTNGAISKGFIDLLVIWANSTTDLEKMNEIKSFLINLKTKITIPIQINQIDKILISLQG